MSGGVVLGSQNFVWFTDQLLGRGASGKVYTGRHRRTGELCAVKVFANDSQATNNTARMSVQQREFETVAKLQHRNIVRFLAIEKATSCPDHVLIMELCSGGSVCNILQEPENAYGFEEEEFLRFLEDITQALLYLRQRGIVHRDIKPGNIMRHIAEDSRSVYKVTDFGSARELAEGEEFVSIHGTEEYLHPDAYERVLFGSERGVGSSASRRPGTGFDVCVDLWSLGVTIYQVATGRLPFRSFGGRQNREDMYRILSLKPRDVISGVQESPNDDRITWSKELPSICRLSKILRRILVKVLSGLLEADRQIQWSFQKFFSASNDVTSRRSVDVFCPETYTNIRLYIKPTDTLAHLQDDLAGETGVVAAQQLLLYEGQKVEDAWPSFQPLKKYFDEDVAFSLVLVSKSSSKGTSFKPMPPLTSIPICPKFNRCDTLSEEAEIAKGACAWGFYLTSVFKQTTEYQQLTDGSIRHLSKLQYRQFELLDILYDLLRSMAKHIKQIALNGSCFRATNEERLIKSTRTESELTQLIFMETDITEKLNFIRHTTAETIVGNSRRHEVQASPMLDNRRMRISESWLTDMKRIYAEFRDHAKRKDLSYNEVQLRKLDRSKLTEIISKFSKLYQENCLVTSNAANQRFLQWNSETYMKVERQIQEVTRSLEHFKESLTNLQTMLIDFTITNSDSTEPFSRIFQETNYTQMVIDSPGQLIKRL